ncbi:hypothetical protein [Turicibacter sanguinis]|uniref:hypothetical protein n=1 Tax=Turicibacter sanguinis TaxID=154288 RepID=UPI00232FF940|nr:hypothetical protein [Turicibacter sanguinis]MDB8437733.1 hypothetical protein [Turicibacter sanguinis]
MIKFSEISDCAYVFYGDRLVCKEEILDEIEEYRDGEFFTAIEKEVGFDVEDAKDMLRELAADLYCNRELYEDWDDEFMRQVDKEDLEQITEVIKRIIKRVPTCYEAGEEIEFDI